MLAIAKRIQQMQNARKSLKKHLIKIQKYQQKYYNKHYIAVTLKKEQIILLNIKNLKLQKVTYKKLAFKYIGLFKMQNAIGTQAYCLQLPFIYCIYNVFYILLLKPYQHRLGKAKINA